MGEVGSKGSFSRSRQAVRYHHLPPLCPTQSCVQQQLLLTRHCPFTWYVLNKRSHLFWCQNGSVVRRKYCLLAEWLMVRKPPAAQRMLKQTRVQKPILLESIAGGIHHLQCQRLLFASASCWGLCVLVSPSVKQIFMCDSSQKHFWDSGVGNVFSLLYC